MPPAIFQLFGVVIALFAFAMAAFPKAMASWQVRRPGDDSRIEPSRGRILMMRIGGVVFGLLALLLAFGGPALLLASVGPTLFL